MKSVLFLATLLFLTSCGTAWVIQRNSYGGAIGYKGYRSAESASEAIKELIPCTYWKIVSDDLASSQRAVIIPMARSQTTDGTLYNGLGQSANYRQTTYGTDYVPMIIDNSYRIFTYTCEERNAITNAVESSPNNSIGRTLLYQSSDINIPTKFGYLNLQKVLAACGSDDKKNDNLFEQIKLTVEKIARKRNYSAILNSEVRDDENITDEVIGLIVHDTIAVKNASNDLDRYLDGFSNRKVTHRCSPKVTHLCLIKTIRNGSNLFSNI